MSKVAVVGVGYVGLTQALGMCKLGHDVIAYDIDDKKVEKLSAGSSTFFEPRLEELLQNQIDKKSIIFTTDISKLNDREFVFLCLPTPQDEDGSADTSHLLNAFIAIAPTLPQNCYVIIKSTVPVGSWKTLREASARDDLIIISNPEFLREGSALTDFDTPDRIVIGAESKPHAEDVSKLYEKIQTKIVITDNTSAELIKYAANSFLAMKLSFVNDIAALCENLEAVSADVLYGIGLDNRIGNKFLTPGPGWGGSCFPKDVRALANIADKEQIMMPLLTAAIESNENAQDRVVKQVNSYFNSESKNITISIWGLSFKANTDDIRHSPAINIARKITKLGYKVICYDPAVPYVSDISVVDNIIESTENSDLIIVLTEWEEFSTIDPTSFVKQVKQKNVLDARSVLNKEKWTNSGFSFI